MAGIMHGPGISDERIIQDIDRWATAVEAIVKAEGAYVEDCDLRNVHRKVAQRLANARDESRLTAKQRHALAGRNPTSLEGSG